VADKFFISSETLAELRSEGLVPVSPLALRCMRCGAALCCAAIAATMITDLFALKDFSINDFTALGSSQITFPTQIFFLLLAPLIATLFLVLVPTKGALSFSLPKAQSPYTPILGKISEIVIVAGVFIIAAILFIQLSNPLLLLSPLEQLRTDPQRYAQLLAERFRLILIITGAILAILSVLIAALEFLLFHLRHRARSQPSSTGQLQRGSSRDQ